MLEEDWVLVLPVVLVVLPDAACPGPPGPGDETTVGDVSPGPIANAVPEGSSAPAPMSPAIASAWQRFIMCSLFFILFSLCKIKGDVQPSAVTSPYIMICFPVRMVRQPGPSVRPASKLLEELPEGLLLVLLLLPLVGPLLPEEVPPGPLLLMPEELLDAPGPPFTPELLLLLLSTVPGVWADTPPAFWHTPLESKLYWVPLMVADVPAIILPSLAGFR